MMRSRAGWLVAMWLWLAGGALSLWGAPAERLVDPPREIFPIPQIASYQQRVVGIPQNGICIVASSGAERAASLAATDIQKLLAERYGQAIEAKVGKTAQDQSLQVDAYLLSDLDRRQLGDWFSAPMDLKRLPEGPRREQAFAIRSFFDQSPRRLVVVGGGTQGIYYGLAALAQLVRFEKGSYTIRGVDLLDWPAFEGRMTVLSALMGRGPLAVAENKQPEIRQAYLRRKTAIQRLTFSVHGYVPEVDQMKERGLIMGAGYWSGIGLNPSKIDPKLNKYNWSDPRTLGKWTDLARDTVTKDSCTMFIWHDGTDAGWWRTYLDEFWARRDEVDRANYPDDPTPARADAARFAAMTKAIRTARPGLPIMYTLPCYYDSPQNDKLARVDLFRDYLKTVGESVPPDVYFILEQRQPADVSGYAKYLKHPLVSYIYGGQEPYSTWARDFRRLGDFYGHCDTVMYGVSDYPDVLDLISAQYMWNPSVSKSDEFIDCELLPRVCYALVGPAWKELAQFILIDLDFKVMREDYDPQVLEANSQRIQQAVQLLATAQQKIPSSWLEAHFLVSCAQKLVNDLDGATQSSLTQARAEIDLSKATAKASSTKEGDPASVLRKNGGLWRSNEKGPHTFEIELPQTYAISTIMLISPHDGGYQLHHGSVEAWVGDAWLPIFNGEFPSAKVSLNIDPVKTNRLRLVVQDGYQWSGPNRDHFRGDAMLSQVKLYGQPAQPDRAGTMSLNGSWFFRLDPQQVGEKENWAKAADFESGWQRLFVPGYWESSSLEGTASYDGIAWYGRSVQLPPSWKNFAITLNFDGVDDEATVWVNGKLAGSHLKPMDPQTWYRAPFSFDITDKLQWDKPNVIVVKVNDIQLQGGIWKPVYLEKTAGPGQVNQQ